MSRGARRSSRRPTRRRAAVTDLEGPLWAASASRLATAIASGEVSSVEVVEAHLRRIATVNPRLNAVVQSPLRPRGGTRADAARSRRLRAGRSTACLSRSRSLETAGVVAAAGPPACAAATCPAATLPPSPVCGPPAPSCWARRTARPSGGGVRARQPGLRAHQQPLRPGAHPGGQQRRRGGHPGRGRVAAGAGERLRGQHPRAGALLRDCRPAPHGRAGAGDLGTLSRRTRGPGPAHGDRADRAARRGPGAGLAVIAGPQQADRPAAWRPRHSAMQPVVVALLRWPPSANKGNRPTPRDPGHGPCRRRCPARRERRGWRTRCPPDQGGA